MQVLHGDDVVHIWSGYALEFDNIATYVTFGDGTVVISTEDGEVFERNIWG